jgi:hypothetical protein
MPPHDDTSYVRCRGCGVESGWQPTPEDVANAWNRRALPAVAASQPADIAEIVRQLRHHEHNVGVFAEPSLLVSGSGQVECATMCLHLEKLLPKAADALEKSQTADPVTNADSRQRVTVKPDTAETLAKEMQAIVAADRWKGRDLSAAPPEKWNHLRTETRQFWIDTATRILSAIDVQPAPRDAQIARLGPIADILPDAVAAAEKAMRKFPQPNYVISKWAEETGEVTKDLIHMAEGRQTPDKLRGEIVQALAMLHRLLIEGDQVHGLPPLAEGFAAVKGGAA